MKLIRYNDPLSTRLRSFDNRLAPSLAHSFGSFDRLFGLVQGVASRNSLAETAGIAADLYEDDDHYYTRVELPGVKKSAVDVSLDERLLTIGVERQADSESTDYFSGERSLTVPDGIDAEKVSAKLEDGVLTVMLPKAEQRKPRAIKIK